MIGVAIGSMAAAIAPPGMFKIAFVVIAGIIATKLLLGRDDWLIAHDLPGRLTMSGYGFLIGLASSLMGISGGSLATLVLTLYGKSIHNAVATSAGIGVPITIAGTVGYCLAGLPYQSQLPPFSIGFVSVIGVLMMAPISSYVAPFGARLAHALPKRRLEVAFGLFLLVASARFLTTWRAPRGATAVQAGTIPARIILNRCNPATPGCGASIGLCVWLSLRRGGREGRHRLAGSLRCEEPSDKATGRPRTAVHWPTAAPGTPLRVWALRRTKTCRQKAPGPRTPPVPPPPRHAPMNLLRPDRGPGGAAVAGL